MSKPVVILADTDVSYIESLEQKFIEELYDKIELEVITDTIYFTEYFSAHRKAEILVLREDMYNQDFKKHNITNIFVLSEKSEFGETEELSATRIFKYTSTKEIYNDVMRKSKTILAKEYYKNRETTVVMIYSNIGGSGKTTVSLALAVCLAQSHMRVLYINMESVQSFQYYLSNPSYLSNSAYKDLRDDNEQLYENIRCHIRTEGFSYIPPLSATLLSLNLRLAFYKKLIETARRSSDYDFIIVDTDGSINDETSMLLSTADKAIIITMQDDNSVFKTECLMKNLDCRDKEKFQIVCNKYSENDVNCLISSEFAKKLIIDGYLDKFDYCSVRSIDDLQRIEGIQKIAYILM